MNTNVTLTVAEPLPVSMRWAKDSVYGSVNVHSPQLVALQPYLWGLVTSRLEWPREPSVTCLLLFGPMADREG